ncbi:hypothetical protein ACHAXS_010146 [Conticribra weissflogii]
MYFRYYRTTSSTHFNSLSHHTIPGDETVQLAQMHNVFMQGKEYEMKMPAAASRIQNAHQSTRRRQDLRPQNLPETIEIIPDAPTVPIDVGQVASPILAPKQTRRATIGKSSTQASPCSPNLADNMMADQGLLLPQSLPPACSSTGEFPFATNHPPTELPGKDETTNTESISESLPPFELQDLSPFYQPIASNLKRGGEDDDASGADSSCGFSEMESDDGLGRLLPFHQKRTQDHDHRMLTPDRHQGKKNSMQSFFRARGTSRAGASESHRSPMTIATTSDSRQNTSFARSMKKLPLSIHVSPFKQQAPCLARSSWIQADSRFNQCDTPSRAHPSNFIRRSNSSVSKSKKNTNITSSARRSFNDCSGDGNNDESPSPMINLDSSFASCASAPPRPSPLRHSHPSQETRKMEPWRPITPIDQENGGGSVVVDDGLRRNDHSGASSSSSPPPSPCPRHPHTQGQGLSDADADAGGLSTSVIHENLLRKSPDGRLDRPVSKTTPRQSNSSSDLNHHSHRSEREPAPSEAVSAQDGDDASEEEIHTTPKPLLHAFAFTENVSLPSLPFNNNEDGYSLASSSSSSESNPSFPRNRGGRSTPQPLNQPTLRPQKEVDLDSPSVASLDAKHQNKKLDYSRSRSRLHSSYSLGNLVRDRRRDEEIRAMLATVEQGSMDETASYGQHSYNGSWWGSTSVHVSSGSSYGNGNYNKNNYERSQSETYGLSQFSVLSTASSASITRGTTSKRNEPDDAVSLVEVGVGSGSGYIRSRTNTSITVSSNSDVEESQAGCFVDSCTQVTGVDGNRDNVTASDIGSNNQGNSFYPNDDRCSPTDHRDELYIPKQYTIRQFPNGDLFSGNVHAETQELIYGRMTYALDMEVYEGPFQNGKRHGDGAVCMKMNGAGKFLGRYHEGDMHSGTLIVSRNNSSDFTYTGTFLNNDFHGEGAIATSNGTIYQGQFAHGQFHGSGTLHDASDDSVYTGDFVEGLFHGSGTIVYADGSKYAGTWYQGCRVEGTEILANGDVFEGSFHENAREGRGVLTRKTSRITTSGVWNKNVLVEGVDLSITFADGHRYAGEHVHSRPHGYGKMDYADFGSGPVSYVGQYLNGFRHGEGSCIFHKTGEEYHGEWICDEPADLKLFQHDGPLCEEAEDNNSAEDVVSSLEPIVAKNVEAGQLSFSTRTTASVSSVPSLVSADSSMNSTITSHGGHANSSKNQYQDKRHIHQRRRRPGRHNIRHVDFNPDSCLDDSLASLNFLDFVDDSPILYRYKNGDIFKGRLDKSNMRQGSGVYTEHRLGTVYDGDWKDNMRHGVGLLTLSSGVEYSGEFFKDRIYGQGSLTLIDASVYTGGFFNGLFHGNGILEDVSNNRTYVGEFENGLRHGEGEEKYADGQFYQGEFKHGKRHGQGTLLDASGNEIYRGEWQHDYMHGKGFLPHHQFQNTTWSGSYEGDFAKGRFCGNGTFTYADGTSIEGQWLDAIPRDGDWTINYPDGSKFYGFATFRHPEESRGSPGKMSATSFSDDALLRVPLPHGFGTLTYPSGKRYIGSFVYGKCEESRA